MTRLQALKELARKVEVGKWWDDIGICSSFCAKSGFTGRQATLMTNVMRNDSLDAAKALHEALLPGWSPVIDICVPCVDMYCEIKDDNSIGTGEWEWMFQVSTDANPARSWLLAILKALIAQEEEG